MNLDQRQKQDQHSNRPRSGRNNSERRTQSAMSYVVHNQHDTGVASSFDDLNEARAFYYIEGCRLRKKYPNATSWAFLSLSEATFGGDEGKCLKVDSEWPPEEIDEWKDKWSDDLVARAQAASDKLAAKYEEQERKWREQNPPRPLKRKVVVELPATANKRARTRGLRAPSAHEVELSMEHDAEAVAKWISAIFEDAEIAAAVATA